MNFQLIVDSHCDNLFAFFEGDKKMKAFDLLLKV